MKVIKCNVCERELDPQKELNIFAMGNDAHLCYSCYNQYEIGGNTGIKIVILEGDAMDWSAYKGYQKDPNWKIAAFGQKVPKNIAEALFPGMVAKGLTYRE